MIISCIDVETTGLDPATDAVCEYGRCDLDTESLQFAVPFGIPINPQRPIPPVASAVHHLTDEDVKDAMPLADVIALQSKTLSKICAAHKCSFEQGFLSKLLPDARWICTWKIAVKLAPNAPGHKLQELRYWLKLEVDAALARDPHRAAPDAYIAACLLARMIASKKMTVEEMVAVSAEPVLLPYLNFGKYAMQPCSEIPESYWSWVTGNIADNEDVLFTARYYLAERRTAQRSRSPV